MTALSRGDSTKQSRPNSAVQINANFLLADLQSHRSLGLPIRPPTDTFWLPISAPGHNCMPISLCGGCSCSRLTPGPLFRARAKMAVGRKKSSRTNPRNNSHLRTKNVGAYPFRSLPPSLAKGRKYNGQPIHPAIGRKPPFRAVSCGNSRAFSVSIPALIMHALSVSLCGFVRIRARPLFIRRCSARGVAVPSCCTRMRTRGHARSFSLSS
jgi:hypothetical protein